MDLLYKWDDNTACKGGEAKTIENRFYEVCNAEKEKSSRAYRGEDFDYPGGSNAPDPFRAYSNQFEKLKIRTFICRRHISYAKRISYREAIFHSFL